MLLDKVNQVRKSYPQKLHPHRPYFHNKNKVIDEILRVNHAGEYGAVRIYRGQIAGTIHRHHTRNDALEHMLSQEQEHLSYFEKQIQIHSSRPTFFLQLWHFGGYMMGKISALISPKAAMLCTEAVEEVIDEHYQSQRQILKYIGEHELADKVEQFRLEELEHKDTAIEHGSHDAPMYKAVKFVIHKICKGAIFLSKAI